MEGERDGGGEGGSHVKIGVEVPSHQNNQHL